MKSNSFLKYLLVAAVVLIVFAIIGKKAGWFGGKVEIKVTAESPQYRTITEVVTASGKIQPETEVKISPDVSGEIVELHIKEGDEVKKGDLLLKIKPDTYIHKQKKLTKEIKYCGSKKQSLIQNMKTHYQPIRWCRQN